MAKGIEDELKNWFANADRIVIAGIGNPIRTDDNVGLRIVEQLKGKLPKTVYLIEAETVPESYLLDIEQFTPTHVLLIDAAFLGLNPGQARLLEPEKIANYSAITTHLLPLHIFCDYIKQTTGAKIALLLVEPNNIEFGEDLTNELQKTADHITKILLKLLN